MAGITNIVSRHCRGHTADSTSVLNRNSLLWPLMGTNDYKFVSDILCFKLSGGGRCSLRFFRLGFFDQSTSDYFISVHLNMSIFCLLESEICTTYRAIPKQGTIWVFGFSGENDEPASFCRYSYRLNRFSAHRNLTFDMSGGQRAQPAGRSLHGLVRLPSHSDALARSR